MEDKSAVFGVRLICGIHIIYSGAVIRGDRQGLIFGKSDTSRCGTHLLLAGSPFAEVRHRRIYFEYQPISGSIKRTVFAVRFCLLLFDMQISASRFHVDETIVSAP